VIPAEVIRFGNIYKARSRIGLDHISCQQKILSDDIGAVALFVLIGNLEDLRPPLIVQDAVGIVVKRAEIVGLVPKIPAASRRNFSHSLQSLPAPVEVALISAVAGAAEHVEYDCRIQIESRVCDRKKSGPDRAYAILSQIHADISRKRIG